MSVNILQNLKFARCVDPGAIVDNASFTVQDIDTRGYHELTIVCYLGATDVAMTALKLQESDDDSTYTDISGYDFSGSLPSDTDDNKMFAFFVPLGGARKRYIRLVATAGNGTSGTYMTALAILARGDEYPSSASERGLAGQKVPS